MGKKNYRARGDTGRGWLWRLLFVVEFFNAVTTVRVSICSVTRRPCVWARSCVEVECRCRGVGELCWAIVGLFSTGVGGRARRVALARGLIAITTTWPGTVGRH